jgi:hypothetical protein
VKAARAAVAVAALLAATTSAQVVQWDKSMPAPLLSDGTHAQPLTAAIAIDAAEHLYVMGNYYTPDHDFDFITLRISPADGSVVWSKPFSGSEYDRGNSVAIDPQGNVVAAGSTTTHANEDMLTLKYDAGTGAVLWQRTFDGTVKGQDSNSTAVVDAQGNVLMVGTTQDTNPWGRNKTFKYSSDGTLLWSTPTRDGGRPIIAVDPSGDVVVTCDGGSELLIRTIKYSGATGSERWEMTIPGGGTEMSMIVDAAGNAIVASPFFGSTGTAFMRVVKYDSASGRVVWDVQIPGTDRRVRGWAVKTDGAGNVVVATSLTKDNPPSGANLVVFALAAADGSVRWKQTEETPQLASVLAPKVDVDSSGNVFVAASIQSPPTGGGFPPVGIETMIALKYSGTDGSVVWRYTTGSTQTNGNVGAAAIVAGAGAVYIAADETVVGVPTMRVIKIGDTAVNVPPPLMPPSHEGLWWRSPAGAQPGWGVNVEHQGDILFATWFTYDTDGSGMWLVMSEGAKTGVDTYSGTLYRTTGPGFDSNPFDPARVTLTEVGTASFIFYGRDDGMFTTVVNGVSFGQPITRQVYANAVPTCTIGGTAGATPNFQGLWWRSPAGSESGWGVNITHQGDILFATWFTYDASGKGMWLVMSDGAKTGTNTYAGTLYRTTGLAYNDALNWALNPHVTTTPVGNATFTFSDANNGNFSYTVNGSSGSKPITRQLFSSPPTVCQ